MKYIELQDSNNNDIFEGDTLTFVDVNILLEDDLIRFLNVDKVCAYVIPMPNRSESAVKLSYYHNDQEVYTFKNKYNYLLEKHKDEPQLLKEIHEWFSEINDPNEPVEVVLHKQNDMISYAHEFCHKEKHITEFAERVEDNEELVLSFNGNQYPLTQSFFVKITQEVKDALLEHHEVLYENENGYEGDFTHILLTPRKYSKTEHSFYCAPVLEDMSLGFYSIVECPSFRNREMTKVLEPIRNETDKWIEENEATMDAETFQRIKQEKVDFYRKTLAELKQKVFKESQLVEKLFIGFGSSNDLLSYLFNQGCEIVCVKDNL